MREHFRGVIWPRGPKIGKTPSGEVGTNYAYTIIGTLVTDEPILGLENMKTAWLPDWIDKDGDYVDPTEDDRVISAASEFVVDGPVEFAQILADLPCFKPPYVIGDAVAALLSLKDLDTSPENKLKKVSIRGKTSDV